MRELGCYPTLWRGACPSQTFHRLGGLSNAEIIPGKSSAAGTWFLAASRLAGRIRV